jgi:hypothetical protein
VPSAPPQSICCPVRQPWKSASTLVRSPALHYATCRPLAPITCSAQAAPTAEPTRSPPFCCARNLEMRMMSIAPGHHGLFPGSISAADEFARSSDRRAVRRLVKTSSPLAPFLRRSPHSWPIRTKEHHARIKVQYVASRAFAKWEPSPRLTSYFPLPDRKSVQKWEARILYYLNS